MAQKYTGYATILGFPGSMSGVAGFAALQKTSADLSVEYPTETGKDDNGAVCMIASAEGMYRFSMNFTVKAGTKTAAALAIKPPERQAAVTLSEFVPTDLNHGRWAIWPGSWKLAYKNDGLVTYSCEIVCSTDAGINLAQTVS